MVVRQLAGVTRAAVPQPAPGQPVDLGRTGPQAAAGVAGVYKAAAGAAPGDHTARPGRPRRGVRCPHPARRCGACSSPRCALAMADRGAVQRQAGVPRCGGVVTTLPPAPAGPARWQRGGARAGSSASLVACPPRGVANVVRGCRGWAAEAHGLGLRALRGACGRVTGRVPACPMARLSTGCPPQEVTGGVGHPASCPQTEGSSRDKTGRVSGQASVPDRAQQGGPGDGEHVERRRSGACSSRLTPGVRLQGRQIT